MDARMVGEADRLGQFPDLLGGSEAVPDGAPVQRILYVTSEMTDYVKAGGLGDVSAALPRSLGQRYDVRVLIPGYRQVTSQEDSIPVVARLPAAHGLPACELGRIDCADGLIVYVILCPELYDREGSPYGDANGTDWADNDLRFARLGLAAAQMAGGMPDLGWTPSLLHLNDWPSALGSAYVAWAGLSTPSVLTIHNLAYQGLFDQSRLPRLGVPASAFGVDGVEFYGKLSFLKAGIVYASHVTTVSETYAREITTPEYGCGLDGLLRKLDSEGRLSGILNGIDESWDPRTDHHLESPFNPNDFKGKKANADEVR
ncbi:MAG: glgA, partial [Enterovirga sp.]|nr:glgA [Enterovirga sp.]